MNNVVKLLNPELMLTDSKQQWLHDDEAITLGEGHTLSMHICPDGAKVFIEKKDRTRPRLFNVKNNHWLKLGVVGGFVQVMPKAVSRTGVLISIALTTNRSLAIL